MDANYKGYGPPAPPGTAETTHEGANLKDLTDTIEATAQALNALMTKVRHLRVSAPASGASAPPPEHSATAPPQNRNGADGMSGGKHSASAERPPRLAHGPLSAAPTPKPPAEPPAAELLTNCA
jgi:hypothetical protein